MDVVTTIIVLGTTSMVAIKAIDMMRRMTSSQFKMAFEDKYGIAVPDDFYVTSSDDDGKFSFNLEFPRWRLANCDGTSQVPHIKNSIEWGKCVLHASGFDLTCKDPRVMYDLVVSMRNVGIEIPKTKVETDVIGNGTGYSFSTIDEIVEKFEPHPTDFETYCALIYEALGYDAYVTPPTNDGGYDIILTAPDSSKTIVECKCFSNGNTVGRPLLQKLVGANSVVHADNMTYITTSSFTKEAVSYADKAHVSLIDGERLLRIAESLKNRDASSNRVLTTYDIESRFPSDWFQSGDR